MEEDCAVLRSFRAIRPIALYNFIAQFRVPPQLVDFLFGLNYLRLYMILSSKTSILALAISTLKMVTGTHGCLIELKVKSSVLEGLMLFLDLPAIPHLC